MKFKYIGNNISIEGMVLEKDKEYDLEESPKTQRIITTLKSKIEFVKKETKKNKEVEKDDR